MATAAQNAEDERFFQRRLALQQQQGGGGGGGGGGGILGGLLGGGGGSGAGLLSPLGSTSALASANANAQAQQALFDPNTALATSRLQGAQPSVGFSGLGGPSLGGVGSSRIASLVGQLNAQQTAAEQQRKAAALNFLTSSLSL